MRGPGDSPLATVTAAPTRQAHEGFRHEALLYAHAEEFLATAVPFVNEGVARDEPVLVAVPAERIRLLRTALGGASERVAFADITRFGGNPARIIPTWRDFLATRNGGAGPARGVGEPIWAGRRPAELVECHRHEALLNLAFADSGPWQLLCPYDVEALPPAVVEEARRTHPYVTEKGHHQESLVCRDAASMAGPLHSPLPEPPPGAAELHFGEDELVSVRKLVHHVARHAGLEGEGNDDLVLAAHEVATNSVQHGGGGGTIRVWVDDGAVVVCEVRDGGHIQDPLAGRQRPEPGEIAGRGLWVANQLCDLVQIRTSPTGTVVRLHKRFGP